MATDLCPWLGTDADSDVRHAVPDSAHVCCAHERPTDIELEHQAQCCLTAEHRNCFYYKEPPVDATPVPMVPETEQDEVGPPPRRFSPALLALWLAVGVVAVALIVTYMAVLRPRQATATPTVATTSGPTPSLTPTGTPAFTPATPSPAFEFVEQTPGPTPYPGGAVFNLSPAAEAAGWLASDENGGNHLGDSYLYSGVFDGVIYHGVFQIDLSDVPRGAAIHTAELEITGLDGRRLGPAGVWEVRILSREADQDWSRKTYQDVHNAAVQWTISPPLPGADLGPGQVNSLVLSRPIVDELEARLLDEHYLVSFRLDGPIAGESNVFAWDTGYGAATQGQRPRLRLSVGASPQTPVPSGTPAFVVVTSTPTPANVVTAAVLARTATAAARALGQPTPTSIYEWTATPELVVTNTPTPANRATADWVEAVVTAIAFTTGTFTPTPGSVTTATPTPVSIPEGRLTPTPSPLPPPPVPAVPAALRGQILFRSDRSGEVALWAMSADGAGVALLTADWPYEVAANREALSPDGRRVAYAGTVDGKPAILVRPLGSRQGQTVAVVKAGQVSAPAWSPTGNPIAFVSTATGRAQVWLAREDGSNLRQLTLDDWGSAGHPTFSPDGQRLAYESAGAEGLRQVWTIALDGSGRVNISNNGNDEWDPVWLK